MSTVSLTAPLDSPYRCPYDGKRMILEPGTNAEGEGHHIHVCWNCDYRRFE